MRNLIKYLLIPIIFIGCSSKNQKLQKKKLGDFLVEGQFLNDSTLNGKAKFFTLDGKLFSEVTFNNGLKNGPSLYFDKGGYKIDSTNYKYGMANGYRYSFDKNGNISYVDYFYMGLNVGPVIRLKEGVTEEYNFIDFNNNHLVDCEYDSLGQVIALKAYATNATIARKIFRGEKMIDFFAYLPRPPGLKIKHTIGITNAEQQDETLFEIKYNNQIFFDSILPYPKDGYHYFISSNIENGDRKINKVIIEEVSTQPPPSIKTKN